MSEKIVQLNEGPREVKGRSEYKAEGRQRRWIVNAKIKVSH